MPNENKVSAEQLEGLIKIQSEFDHLTKRYGELFFQKKIVLQEMESVEMLLETLNQRRNQVVKDLQEYFGSAGTIDLSTGDFLPEK